MAARRATVVVGIAAVVVAGAVVAMASTSTAAPKQTFPGNTRSHYLTTVDRAVVRSTAARDARDANRVGIASALVVLDAGSPADTAGSVRLPDTGAVTSAAAVRDAAVAYAAGWSKAHGPRLVLVVGVANAGKAVGARSGAAWGRLVDAVAARVDGALVDVRGGIDAELEYGSPARTLAWVHGYLGATRRGYVDFGSCTCGPGRLPARWTRAQRAAVAIGAGRAVAVPQIYATGGGNARAWAALADWARARRPHRPIRIVGALTEVAACTGPPRRPCAGIDAAPEVAWAQLTEALGSAGDDLRYATDLGYLPHRGAVHGPLAPVGGPVGFAAVLLAAAVAGLGVGVYVVRQRSIRRPRRRRRPVVSSRAGADGDRDPGSGRRDPRRPRTGGPSRGSTRARTRGSRPIGS